MRVGSVDSDSDRRGRKMLKQYNISLLQAHIDHQHDKQEVLNCRQLGQLKKNNTLKNEHIIPRTLDSEMLIFYL